MNAGELLCGRAAPAQWRRSHGTGEATVTEVGLERFGRRGDHFWHIRGVGLEAAEGRTCRGDGRRAAA